MAILKEMPWAAAERIGALFHKFHNYLSRGL